MQTISCDNMDAVYTVPSKLLFKDWARSETRSKIMLVSNHLKESVLAVLCPPSTDRFKIKPAKRQKEVSRATIQGLGDAQGKVYLCHLGPRASVSFKLTFKPGESDGKGARDGNFQDALSVHALNTHLVVPILAVAVGESAKPDLFEPKQVRHPSLRAINAFLQTQRLAEKEAISRGGADEPAAAGQETKSAAEAGAGGGTAAGGGQGGPKKKPKGKIMIPELANLAKWSMMTKEEKKRVGPIDEKVIDDVLQEEYEESDDGDLDHLQTSARDSARYKRSNPYKTAVSVEREEVASINPAQIVAQSKNEADISRAEELEFYNNILKKATQPQSSAQSRKAGDAKSTGAVAGAAAVAAAAEPAAPVPLHKDDAREVAFEMDGKKYDAFGREIE